MTRAIATVAFAAILALSGGVARSAASPVGSDVDADFVRAAAESHATETALARLELARGSSDEARSFAKRMLEDHPPLDAGLVAIAPQARSQRTPTAPDRLARARLKRADPVTFDQQYLVSQVTGHLVAVAVFEAEAADGTDPRLRAYARATLPTLREHLAVAMAGARHVGGASPFKGPQ